MIIGISGKARSGKDTFAEMLATELNKGAHPPYVMMAFANELKLRCQAAFDLTWEQLWGDDKEVADARYLRTHVQVDQEPLAIYWTSREIMQDYGAFYRTIDNEFWVKNLFKVMEDKEYKNVIITDVRYTNEANYILDNGGYVIRVEREIDFTVVNNWTLDHLKLAASETASFLRDSENDLKKLKEIRING